MMNQIKSLERTNSRKNALVRGGSLKKQQKTFLRLLQQHLQKMYMSYTFLAKMSTTRCATQTVHITTNLVTLENLPNIILQQM